MLVVWHGEAEADSFLEVEGGGGVVNSVNNVYVKRYCLRSILINIDVS